MLRSRAEPVKDSLRRALSGASLTEPARPQKRISRDEGEGSFSKDFPGKLTSRVEHTQGAGHLDLGDARRKIRAWVKDYNEQRPHSSLGYLTPNEFAATARVS